ncbi:MAG: hypothetical protein ABIT37_00955 [Luteolibacter sp.]
MKSYFYIYRVGYGKPTIKHQTLELAHAEAMRLAGQHPGETFELLECLGIVQTTTPQAFWMDGVTLPAPSNRDKGMICGECNVLAMGAKSMTCLRDACPGKSPENVKEHATPLAGASVETGGEG